MAKMAVVGKNKKKSLKKTAPVKGESKVISQALINRKKSQKAKKKKRPRTRGMVYVKNLPHGFFEEQLRDYFSQFGAITRLRLGRSPKTLNSRGYAFIEFRYPEVAEIAAETMNNYIMFHRIVKAKYIPPSEIQHDYFRSSVMTIRKNGEKMLTSKSILARQRNVENTNKLMTDEDQKSRISKVRNKVSKAKARLEQLGIDFDVDIVAKNMGEEVIAPKQKHIPLTIDNLKEDDLDDEADETFDPSKFDIDSNDEFEDYNYDSDESESENEEVETLKKGKAIEVAKKVSKKQQSEGKTVDKKSKVVAEKKSQEVAKTNGKSNAKTTKKTQKVAEMEVEDVKPTKKQKVAKKPVEEVPKIEKKVTRSKPSNHQEEPEKVEKIAKKLKEKKKIIKSAEPKLPAVPQKKAQKTASEKQKSTQESPKLKKVSKVSKKIKKVSAK